MDAKKSWEVINETLSSKREKSGRFFNDGLTLKAEGQTSQALESLLKARENWLEAMPDSDSTPAIETSIAECLETLGRREEALQTYKRALEIINNNAIFNHHKQKCLEGIKNLE